MNIYSKLCVVFSESLINISSTVFVSKSILKDFIITFRCLAHGLFA